MISVIAMQLIQFSFHGLPGAPRLGISGVPDHQEIRNYTNERVGKA